MCLDEETGKRVVPFLVVKTGEVFSVDLTDLCKILIRNIEEKSTGTRNIAYDISLDGAKKLIKFHNEHYTPVLPRDKKLYEKNANVFERIQNLVGYLTQPAVPETTTQEQLAVFEAEIRRTQERAQEVPPAYSE